MAKDKSHCSGCRDDFYNHPGQHGSKECWHLNGARVVRRWRLGWWTSPVTPGAFVEVKTYDCHHEPGQFAFSKELPSHAVRPARMLVARSPSSAATEAEVKRVL